MIFPCPPQVLTALLWRLASDCSPEMLQEAREGLQLRRNPESVRLMLASLAESSLPFLWQRRGSGPGGVCFLPFPSSPWPDTTSSQY